MDAVIIAAGAGTRMRPLTADCPKPLLPVGQRSLLERLMDQCVPHIDQFVIVVGYQAAAIRDHVGETHRGCPVNYAVQDEQLGTAHAIQQARRYVSDAFIVLNGDVLIDETIIEQLVAADPPAMTTTTVADPTSYGVVETASGTVTALHEKPDAPPSDQINVGLYGFSAEIFDAIAAIDRSPRGEYEITDAIELLIDQGHHVESIPYSGTWIDVGRPWELLEAMDQELATVTTSVDGDLAEDVTITGQAVIEPGVTVRSGVCIDGPVVIREGATVGPNAYIRGPAVIEADASVGHAVEIKHSILRSGTAVNHLSYVGDSILGRDVNFGAGTVVGNLRHDDSEVTMQIKGEPTTTGRRKLGVVVGHDTKTGINTSLNPGVKLSPGTQTMPGAVVFEDQ